jgi:N-methylhydantoinase B
MEIAGSERFSSLAIDFTTLPEAIPPRLKLHTVPAEVLDDIDPITYEVIRHRLWSITEEMGTALKRMSGSVAVTDCNDFNFMLTDELGQCAQIGTYNTMIAAGADAAIHWTLANRSDNPGIEEGDVWLCNDPWVGGGQHQNDVMVYAPVFWEGELFAWSAAIAHQVDVGGVAPGSWTPRSQDVFWESLPTPPVKMVRAGRLQQDMEDMYLRRSRMPQVVALDLRAKIGSNAVANERLTALIEKYGADLVKAVMKRIMDDSERRLREKLRRIPDGTWRTVIYQEQAFEGDRGVYRIALAMTKEDDHLTFDFTGTDAQKGMINCTYAGARGGVLSGVLPLLCGDLTWAAGGVLRCIGIVSEPGTLNNATFPAGVCKGSVSSTWATSNAAIDCISKMLDTAPPELRENGMASPAGTWDLGVVAGATDAGNPFVGLFLEPMAAGMGARFDQDGVDTGGLVIIPQGRAPDVEVQELAMPMLYLWRREEIDSGGPGRHRGGVSGSVCVVPHGTSIPMHLVSSGSGKATTMNAGLAGGYPGNNQLDIVFRGARARALLAGGEIPASFEEVGGDPDVLGAEIETFVDPGDAFFMHWQAGGGYGDPILREPERVAADVREAKVSPDAARDIYGVVIDAETAEADLEATAARRAEIMERRSEQARVGAGSAEVMA